MTKFLYNFIVHRPAGCSSSSVQHAQRPTAQTKLNGLIGELIGWNVSCTHIWSLFLKGQF